MKLRTKPSGKGRKRYIVFRIHSSSILPYYNIQNAVFDSMKNWLGMKELAESHARVIKNLWNERQQAGIIVCSHRFVDGVKMALALITQIGDEKVVFRTFVVSGTIKAAKEKAKARHSISL